jgi:hypothetical protein
LKNTLKENEKTYNQASIFVEPKNNINKGKDMQENLFQRMTN